MSNRFRKLCARLSLVMLLLAWLPLFRAVVCEAASEGVQSGAMADCADSDTLPPSPTPPDLPDDCGFKLCLVAKIFGHSDWKASHKLEALLVWAGGWLLILVTVLWDFAPKTLPPPPLVGPSPPLIYRFCRLLD